MPARYLPLRDIIAALRKHYGKPEPLPSTDAFELVLFENVSYLTTQEKRRAAFALLRQTIGTEPAALLRATRAQLERVTSHGILKAKFADKLRTCAHIALDEFGGDLNAGLGQSATQAQRALRRFPGIGAPGADRILLLSGRRTNLAPESNGLRVLARLGVIADDASYARLYKAGNAAGASLPQTIASLRAAHHLLQQHGQTLCRISAPQCSECPLQRRCTYAATARLQVKAARSADVPRRRKSMDTARRRRA